MVKSVILSYLLILSFVSNLSAQFKLFPNYLNIQNGLSDNQSEIKQDVKQLTGEVKVIHDVLVAYIADKK